MWNLEHTITTSEADIMPIIRTATTPITLHIIAAESEPVPSKICIINTIIHSLIYIGCP